MLLFPALLLGGCAGLVLTPTPPQAHPSDLRVTMRDGGSLLFQDGHWRLTPAGIEGRALDQHSSGRGMIDTSVSYLQIAAAEGNREDPWTQLMLTMLGVLIVVGLAGVILYAAFRATER